MNYAEIIQDNCVHHSAVHWWPKFGFHYTDIRNAVSILSSEYLYSRTNAEKLGLMKNDNASRQVIDMTKTEAAANVRFYFRPLTPTQYHNEGYKHPSLRYDGDSRANMPVPIFFAFDLEKLLTMPGICFSEKAQSGYGASLHSKLEEFAQFSFDKIYSNGYDENWRETQKYRHAELLYPGKFNIDSCLTAILCRNDVERTTLLNLLQQANIKQYYKYRPCIKLCREDMFESNGLFINGCQYHNNTVSVSFSNTYSKVQHTWREMERHGLSSLSPINGRLELVWSNKKEICYKATTEVEVDYLQPQSITFTNLPVVPTANIIQISFFFDDNIMCYITQPLSETELIR